MYINKYKYLAIKRQACTVLQSTDNSPFCPASSQTVPSGSYNWVWERSCYPLHNKAVWSSPFDGQHLCNTLLCKIKTSLATTPSTSTINGVKETLQHLLNTSSPLQPMPILPELFGNNEIQHQCVSDTYIKQWPTLWLPYPANPQVSNQCQDLTMKLASFTIIKIALEISVFMQITNCYINCFKILVFLFVFFFA